MFFFKKKAVFYVASALAVSFQVAFSSSAFAMGVDYDAKGGGGGPAHRVSAQDSKGDKATQKASTIHIDFDESLQKWLAKAYSGEASDLCTEPVLTFVICYAKDHIRNNLWVARTPLRYVAGAPPQRCEIDVTKGEGSENTFPWDFLRGKYDSEEDEDASMYFSCDIGMHLKKGSKDTQPHHRREWKFVRFRLKEADTSKSFLEIVLGRNKSISLGERTGCEFRRDGRFEPRIINVHGRDAGVDTDLIPPGACCGADGWITKEAFFCRMWEELYTLASGEE